MSLFKARDWWSTQCGTDEDFDQGCLLLANIDDEPSITDKIIVGSHSGYLRIYRPSPDKGEDEEAATGAGFKPTDLLIEKQFNQPVLQLGVGRLVS